MAKKKFSLVELLVVVAVISMLAALLLPALQKAKTMALTIQCKSNQRQCGLALVGYANDFDGWTIGGECGFSPSPAYYTSLGPMMMGFGYVPKRGDFTGESLLHGFCGMPFGAVFQCPSLSPPSSYKQYGGVYPSGKNNCTTTQSYGLRYTDSATYYPGEQVPSGSTRGMIKLASLYRPSELPFMVDSAWSVNDPSDSVVAGRVQWYVWYITWTGEGSIHLRHSRRGNVWCPDGHVASWGSADAVGLTKPGNNAVSNNPLGYFY